MGWSNLGGCDLPERQKKRSKTPTEDLGKRGSEPKDKAASGEFMNSVGRGRSALLIRGDGVCQPGPPCANGVADGRKTFSEVFFPRH